MTNPNEIVSAEAVDAAVTADIATYGPTCLEDDWRDDDRADDMRNGMRAALLASGYPQKVVELEEVIGAERTVHTAEIRGLRAENEALRSLVTRVKTITDFKPLAASAASWNHTAMGEIRDAIASLMGVSPK